MTYRIELTVDAANKTWALTWMKNTIAAIERNDTEIFMEAGGGGGRESFSAYAGPKPPSDKERIEALEAAVTALSRKVRP